MFVQRASQLSLDLYVVLGLSLVILYLLRNKYRAGLNKYPGPVLASITDWWRFFDVRGKRAQHTHISLHRQHGDIVRLGPNVLSFANPRAVKEIYGLGGDFIKSEFYDVQNKIARGRRVLTLFTTRDRRFHAQFKRCVNSAFAMSTLVSYEPFVDSTTALFLEQTKKHYCDADQSCDFPRWLQFYAFDVIGQMSFSKRLGFLENVKDVGNIIAAIADNFSYAAPMGQMPSLDRYLLRKNPVKMLLMRLGLIASNDPMFAFAEARSAERRQEIDALRQKTAAEDIDQVEDSINGVDFLTRFMLAQKAHPEFMNETRVLSAATSLITAGSDTTAISLSAVFYYLLKNPKIYRKLISEIDSAIEKSVVVPNANGIISWADAQKLSYLDAVIQETFRLYPAVGLLLERVSPIKDTVICGEVIPKGTVVGCNAWVIQRRPEIYGEDVDDFRPERWLEATPESLSEMKAAMLHFGAGSRTCIGRNISILEMYKFIPSLLRNFYIELADPNSEWTTENCWFVRQLNFNVKFRVRKS